MRVSRLGLSVLIDCDLPLANCPHQLAELGLVQLDDAIKARLEALNGVFVVHRHHRLVAIVVRSVIKHLEAKVTCKDFGLTTKVHLEHELAQAVGHGPHYLCVDFHQVGVHHLAVLGLREQPEIELVISAYGRLVVLLDQFGQHLVVADVPIKLAEDASGLASLLVRLLKEIRPAIEELVKVME